MRYYTIVDLDDLNEVEESAVSVGGGLCPGAVCGGLCAGVGCGGACTGVACGGVC